MIKIRRVGKVPAICVSYPCDGTACAMIEAIKVANASKPKEEWQDEICPQLGSHLEQWRPDPEKKEFSVSAGIARAAVDSGYFEEIPESQAKLKGGAAVTAPLTE